MFRKSLIALAVGLVISPFILAHAESSSESIEPSDTTETIVVIGKVPRIAKDVVGAVSVIDSNTIDNNLIHDMNDLVRYQVGLNVSHSGNRFGSSSISIRGIGGNRVSTEIDGVPIADQFSIGSYSNSGRNTIDFDLIKQVEILRGPASSLYGSDAIGGVLSYITKKPDDLLSETDKPVYLGAKVAYHSIDKSRSLSFNSAFASGKSSLLFSTSFRKGHELAHNKVSGKNRDRQNNDSNSFLVKYFYDLTDDDQLSFSYDYFQRNAQSDTQSLLGVGRFRSTTALLGDDKTTRKNFTANYEFVADQNWLSGGVIRYYHQATNTKQLTDEKRFSRGVNYLYNRDFFYKQAIDGFRANLYANVNTTNFSHQIGYGLEWSNRKTTELRDGLKTNLDNNTSTTNILSEQFPLRDFPISNVTELGVYVNDKIYITDTHWSIIPALRFDKYKLSPQQDAVYLADNPTVDVVSINENSFSPKIGVNYQLTDDSDIYFQYIKGFRAPPFEDANIGLDIPMFKIKAIPNPNLKSETTNGYELGYKLTSDNHKLSIVGFYNDYKDFIETKVNLGFDPISQRVLFQSQNINNAKIYGFELNYQYSLTDIVIANDLVRAYSNLSISRGENKDTNKPINSIEPDQAIVGVEWYSPNQDYSLALNATLVAAKSNVDELADPDSVLFKTAGYITVDIIVNYELSDKINISAAINNITDKKYYRWSDVNGMLVNDPLLDSLSAAGINASLQLKASW